MNINSISADVNNQIFGHLDAPDLMKSKLVCKDWNQLINAGLGTWFDTPSNKEFAAQKIMECFSSQALYYLKDFNDLDIMRVALMKTGGALLKKCSFSFQDLVEVCRLQRSDVVKDLISIDRLISKGALQICEDELEYPRKLSQGELDNAEGVSENLEHTDDTKGENLSQATKLAEKFVEILHPSALAKHLEYVMKEGYIEMKNHKSRLLALLLCKKFSLEKLERMLCFIMESSVGINFFELHQQLSTKILPKLIVVYVKIIKSGSDSEEDYSGEKS